MGFSELLTLKNIKHLEKDYPSILYKVKLNEQIVKHYL